MISFPKSINRTFTLTLSLLISLQITAQEIDGRIKDVLDPVDAQDAATKAYVDSLASLADTSNTNELQQMRASRSGDTLYLSGDGYLIIPGLSFANNSVQENLEDGISPIEIYNSGVPLDSLYGKNHNGGLLFYLDTQDTILGLEALVAAPSDLASVATWGCENIVINIPQVTSVPPTGPGAEIGDGVTNAFTIESECAQTDIAAKKARAYDDGTWYLPSVNELVEMYDKLGVGNFSDQPYWSSTQANAYYAWYKHMGSASAPLLLSKSANAFIRPVRTVFEEGVSVQKMLELGSTPKSLYDSGIPLDSLYGKTYAGGLIFYLNTIDGTGLVAAPTDAPTTLHWGNSGGLGVGCNILFTGAILTGIGDGATNTMTVLNADCDSTGSAFHYVDTLSLDGYTDWFLPSLDELYEMYKNLHRYDCGASPPFCEPFVTCDHNVCPTSLGGFGTDEYWSSTAEVAASSFSQSILLGVQYSITNNTLNLVRAIRAF